jgi:hypothetical protein
MARVHICRLLCIALLASTAADALGQPASSMTVSGVYALTFNLSILSTLPTGTTVTCRARIAPNPGELDLGNPRLVAVQVETAAGVAAVNGSTVTCATEIPFSWTVMSAQGGVVLSYEIDAVSSAGLAPLLLRSSARQGIGAAFPPAGETTSLSFNITF